MKEPKPRFLLSDSQILFRKEKEGLFLQRKDCLGKNKKIENIKASNIGASNGDNPAFLIFFMSKNKTTFKIKSCLTFKN